MIAPLASEAPSAPSAPSAPQRIVLDGVTALYMAEDRLNTKGRPHEPATGFAYGPWQVITQAPTLKASFDEAYFVTDALPGIDHKAAQIKLDGLVLRSACFDGKQLVLIDTFGDTLRVEVLPNGLFNFGGLYFVAFSLESYW